MRSIMTVGPGSRSSSSASAGSSTNSNGTPRRCVGRANGERRIEECAHRWWPRYRRINCRGRPRPRPGTGGAARSAEGRDDVLGKQLHLAHLLLPGHGTLVEKPSEPFEIAFAADPLQRVEFGLDLVDRSGERVFSFAHALDRPLGCRQHRSLVFSGILRHPERLPEAKAAEIIVETGIVGFAQQRHRLLLGSTEMDGTNNADAFAESELATGPRSYFLIHPAQPLEIGRISSEDDRDDAGLRGVADRRLANRERLEQRRMRVLVALGRDANPAQEAVLVNLTGSLWVWLHSATCCYRMPPPRGTGSCFSRRIGTAH